MNIGKVIAEQREARSMTQQTLADLLFVSRDLISKWENGTRTPDYPMIERIAGVFGVSPDLLFDKNDLILEELAECVSGTGVLPQELLTQTVNNFLRKIGGRNADIFLARYYYLKTTAQIAYDCRLGENHVRSILSKTRKKLKKFIEEKGS